MRRITMLLIIVLSLLVLWVALVILAMTVTQLRVPVDLSSFNEISSITDDYVKASGTWVIEGDSQAYPIQTTEIWCERELHRCSSATAEIISGEQMVVHLDFFEVNTWDKNQVIFTDASPSCVDYIHTINLLTKSVTALRQKKLDTSKSIRDCSAVATELRLTLRKGSEVVAKARNEALPWFGELALSPLKLFR